ncbi:hypothetical protein Patl1_13686 [Pistacia atlantica]|uniref:Uncharacterized protein n=1 Tax=Pistacia atlantica TaxID=434234 RepID=A0ACC1ASC7_9ROSI|nr:hypothetical protein Patl1_13686 [Pistacia atlantica]
MSTLKNKGKRPIVHDSHDPPIKKRSTSSGTPKLTTRISSSKSQEQENATETDVKEIWTWDMHPQITCKLVEVLCHLKYEFQKGYVTIIWLKEERPFQVLARLKDISPQTPKMMALLLCMSKYVASKLQENIIYIRCPLADCKGLLEPEYCHKILPQDVFDRWNKALCEDVIPGAQKFYCPFKSCSALMISDGEVIMESECPHCYRLFCAQCKVPWHAGISCAEFKKLNKNESSSEDMMLMKACREEEMEEVSSL